MPTPATLLHFGKDVTFPGGTGAVGIDLPAASDPLVAAALAADTPFPDRQLELGSFHVRAEAGQDFALGDGMGQVAFSGSASAFAGLGVYPDPAELLKALPLEDSIEQGLRLERTPEHQYLLLQWGYDAKAAVKGSLALGFGASATFGVDARSEGLLAVVRRVPKTTGALTAVASAVVSLRLPRQVRTPDDLPPGAWLVAEVDGGIGVKLGAQFGYDFNWSRETKLGGLKEDIGLKLQLAVSAALGLEASGKYAVVVGRESLDPGQQKVRVQLLKLSKRGLSFAFNAGATVQANFSNLPVKADDFIKAVFDVHGGQIIDDLHAIEKWTDPNMSLSDALAGLTVDYGKELLTSLTGVDAEAAFSQARKKLLDFLSEWDKLPHRAASTLFTLVENHTGGQLDGLRQVAGAIAAGDAAALRSQLQGALAGIDFFTTPEGQWLESVATSGVLGVLNNSAEFKKLQAVAAVTHAILDPHTLEDTLRRLQAELAKRLNLDILLQQPIPDAARVDAWLKKKLSHFLDKAIQSGTELDEARKTIHFLLGKRQEFYEKARKALTQKYEAAFAATYQKTVTGTALVDAEFDFAADAAGAGRLLAACLRGDFNRVFTESNAAVRLNQATLSHQIARTSHVELHLPRFARAVDHLNDALAKVSAVEDGGRLLVYDLTATDTVSERNRRNSRLAVAAHLPARKGTGVRVHSTDSISYSYAFRQAVRNMRSSHLRSQVKPYLETYFGAQFTGQASISAWIADLDKQIDRIEFNGTENFGNTLLSLELSLPAEVAAGWLQAPEDKKSPRYMDMSRRIQAKLKQLIPFYYFDDAAKYRDLGAAAPLLVYSSIPPSTDIKLLGDTLTLNPENPDGPYWDFEDRAVRKAMVFNSRTSDALSRALQRAHDALLDAGFSSDAVFFASGELDDFRKTATSGDGDRKLTSLLFVEAEIIDQAHRAGRALAKFRQQAEAGPEDAVQALAAFGAAVTEAFNKNVTGIYGGGSLRPLGTMLFLEAALAFLPGPAAFRPSAIFELTVVKQNAPFALPGFVDVNEPARPEKPDIVIQERLVALA